MIDTLPKRIHCVGAGGAGMLPLALYLASSGHDVTAEDAALSAESQALLEKHGVAICPFREEENLAIVYSSAISERHEAREFARRTGSVSMRRGECLAVIASQKKLIAIAGSHGKTTTCGMLVDLFGKLPVEYVLGAQFVDSLPYSNVDSEWLVAEIDESDGTIELFTPEIAVILNADHDHHSRYETAEGYLSVFKRLIQRTKGIVFASETLQSTFADAVANSNAEVKWIGKDIRYEIEPIGSGWSRLNLDSSGIKKSVSINRIGKANCEDAAFAISAAVAAGCSIDNGGQVEFRSIRRRQSCLYASPSVCVLEDYAHHPAEISAVLEQVRSASSERLVVVFQPHRYSRTAIMKSELASSLSDVDSLLLLDVYAASEEEVEGGRGLDLLEACQKLKPDTTFCPNEAILWEKLDTENAASLTNVLFIGAGFGDRLAREYADRLVDQDRRWGPVYRSIGQAGGFTTRIAANESLANKTTMKVGGVAERYFEPNSARELQASLKACYDAGIKVSPLGRGSNVVVPDEGVSGLVIRLKHPIWNRFENLGDGSIRVGAGLRIKVLCGQACKAGLGGYEFLEGIPGNLGGVLRMNAGAMGGWIFDVVESVRFVTQKGDLIEAKKDDLEFGYRYCRELESAIAIEATLRVSENLESQESIRRKIDTYQSKRRESQPREPSAGCIFKNPEGDSAGRLIEELGLKGAVVGGAEISETHGNFIINRGGAKSEDVVALVKLARKVAFDQKGIVLEPEALLFGSKWEDVLK